MYDLFASTPRLLLRQELAPVQGDRFQPTGFADLGAAIYTRPDGRRMLLVESAQSVANRLEAAILENGTGPGPMQDLEGLPYVRVKLSGASDAVTSSLVEAHRLNSPFIIKNDAFEGAFLARSGYAKGQLLDWPRIAATVFFFDPCALLHGVFMANLQDGRIKVPRLLSGFIEAADACEAVSGGVKNNPLDPSGSIRVASFDKNVYGNVPYSRTEYTAATINAYFNLDLTSLRAYRLPDAAFGLLVSLSLLKVRLFLESGLRLRTACDLAPRGPLQLNQDVEIPAAPQLLAEARSYIRECGESGLFASPAVTEITTATVEKKADKNEKSADENSASD